MTGLPRSIVLDALDYGIIKELRRGVRGDAAKVARALNANQRTVRKRIDRLVGLHAIRMVAIANPKVFGYVTEAQALLEIDPQYEEAAVEHILGMPEVSYVAYGQGPRDLWIRARFKDNAEIRGFERRTLPSVEGVSVVSFSLVPRVLREANEWMPRVEDFSTEGERFPV